LRVEVDEACLAPEDRPSERTVPARIASSQRLRERLGLDHVGRDEQALGERVDAFDVGMEQVAPADALAAQLGVEVEAAGREAAGLHDLVDRERELDAKLRRQSISRS